MIQHVLHWNYKDDVAEEDRASIEAELEALPTQVPSLRSLRWGPVIGGRNQTFSHTFVMLFDDLEGLQEYALHPAHVSFAAPFREACAAQIVIDFKERV